MKSWIERALNVSPGDLGRGTLLGSCLFLVITSTVIGKVAGAALFLSRFPARQLAWVEIASAIAVVGVIATYAVTARQTPIANLVAGSMFFFGCNCVLFWGFAQRSATATWLYPLFYAWVRIVAVLAPAQIWTLASCSLTTREAKRIFGILGSGAILGWMVAGFLSRAVVFLFGTESLLLLMAVLLTTCGGLVTITWRYGHAFQSAATVTRELASGDQSAGSTLGMILGSPYLRAISAVICISSFITTLTGWQFLAIAQQSLVSKDSLAAYFGGFNFMAGLLSLLIQILLTTRLVRRFGIGISLTLLPITILLGSTSLLIFGSLRAAVALRGCDQILRYSIDRSTTELLYLPIATRIKLKVKWFIDTLIWRLGDGAAGIVVLVFATLLRLPAKDLSGIAIVAVSLWLFSVSIARREYLVLLRQNINQHTIQAEQLPAVALDRSTTELLADRIEAADPKEIVYALDLLQTDERAMHPAIRTLLTHPVADIRRRAIRILSDAGDKAARQEIERLLHDTDLDVRTDALLYLSRHAHVDPLQLIDDPAKFPDFSVSSAVVAYLAKPGESQNLVAARHIFHAMLDEPGPDQEQVRMEVASLLGELPDEFDPLLATLLAEKSSSIAVAAIRSVAKLHKIDLAGDLIARLAKPSERRDAAKALASLGDPVVGALRESLSDEKVPIEIRREIPAILLSIGTPAAQRALLETLLQSEIDLRYSIICSLNKLQHLNPGVELDRAILETVLAAEILGHYRSYQIINRLQEPSKENNSIGTALELSLENERERIFRLLAMLYPGVELKAAYLALQSTEAVNRDDALEFLDNVLKPPMREILVPLLDSRIPVAEKARLGSRHARIEFASREEAVTALISSDDPWLRACGAYAIGWLGMTSLEGVLSQCLSDPDPLLRETARAAKERLRAASAHA